MFGKLKEEEIEEVLHSLIIGRIGCSDKKRIYIVPISYAYDGEFVYCHTYEGLKVSMMRANPNVCFEVDTWENMGNWKSVIISGRYEEVTDKADRKLAVEKLYNRVIPQVASVTLQLTSQWPFPPDDSDIIDGIIFRIKPEEKSGRFESSKFNHYAKLQG